MNPYQKSQQGNMQIDQDLIDAMNKRIEAMNLVGGKTDSGSMHNNLYNQYLSLVGDMYPGRAERLNEAQMYQQNADPYVSQYGNDLLRGVSGAQEDPAYMGKAMTDYMDAEMFAQEFMPNTGDTDIDRRNAQLQALAQTNPSLAAQYMNPDSNPNLLQRIGGRIQSLIPEIGNNKNFTYDEIMKKKQLKNAGILDYLNNQQNAR